MPLKQPGEGISTVYQLMDEEGFEAWKKDNELSETNTEVMLKRFFKQRDDMTAEDFYAGRDPLLETEGD